MRKLGVRSSPILELEGGEMLPWADEAGPEVETTGLRGGWTKSLGSWAGRVRAVWGAKARVRIGGGILAGAIPMSSRIRWRT